MTIREKKSQRKALAIRTLVDNGEYSPAYGLLEADRLNDEGLILDVDYEPLAEYLEELINKPVKEPEEQMEEVVEEATQEVTEEENTDTVTDVVESEGE